MQIGRKPVLDGDIYIYIHAKCIAKSSKRTESAKQPNEYAHRGSFRMCLSGVSVLAHFLAGRLRISGVGTDLRKLVAKDDLSLVMFKHRPFISP